ncbi:MAG: hypothetical protein EBV86_09035 [Marivivens sp.]|nr:hypothetical protein [Marivivens sp.]
MLSNYELVCDDVFDVVGGPNPKGEDLDAVYAVIEVYIDRMSEPELQAYVDLFQLRQPKRSKM